MVYLPMCFIYCKRFVPADIEQDPILMGLRSELYLENEHYDSIKWDSFRQTCAPIDEYSPVFYSSFISFLFLAKIFH
jgi:hypothetical protein